MKAELIQKTEVQGVRLELSLAQVLVIKMLLGRVSNTIFDTTTLYNQLSAIGIDYSPHLNPFEVVQGAGNNADFEKAKKELLAKFNAN